jgi:hypothetical protein
VNANHPKRATTASVVWAKHDPGSCATFQSAKTLVLLTRAGKQDGGIAAPAHVPGRFAIHLSQTSVGKPTSQQSIADLLLSLSIVFNMSSYFSVKFINYYKTMP